MSTHTERFFSRKSSGRYGHGIRLNQVNFIDASFGGLPAPGMYNISLHARARDRPPAGPPTRPGRAVRSLPLPGAAPDRPRAPAGHPRPADSHRDPAPRLLAGVLRPRSAPSRLGPPAQALADDRGGPRLRRPRHPPDPGGDRGLRGAQVPHGVATVRARSPGSRGPRGAGG